jgi:type I restriction enzyme R subunit
MSQTTERAFETYVEAILLNQAGWQMGDVGEWDVERALFPARIFDFIKDTQPKLWEEMQKLHGAGLENLLLSTLSKELDVKGALHVLRHGFKFYGKTFRLAYFKPAHGLSPDVLALFYKNRGELGDVVD